MITSKISCKLEELEKCLEDASYAGLTEVERQTEINGDITVFFTGTFGSKEGRLYNMIGKKMIEVKKPLC